MSDKFRLFYNWDPSDPPRAHYQLIDREYFEWLFSMLEGTGLTFLYRCNLSGRAYYRSRWMAQFDHDCINAQNSSEELQLWHKVADMLAGCDPLAEAVTAARRHGVEIWGWFNWNEFQCVRQGCLDYIDPLWYREPRKYWCSRDGSRFYHGVPDFGDSGVQKRLLGLAEEVADYGLGGVEDRGPVPATFRTSQHRSPYGCGRTTCEGRVAESHLAKQVLF